jgi:hypothetical protein
MIPVRIKALATQTQKPHLYRENGTWKVTSMDGIPNDSHVIAAQQAVWRFMWSQR